MDNLSYLNQIANDTNKEKTKNSSGSLLENKKFRIFLIIAGALILICIIIGIIGNILNRETDYLPRLKLRADNISKIVNEYNQSVKSSSLRAAGSSLSGVLDNLSTSLPTYIKKDYKIPEAVTAEETKISAGITNALDNAKINAMLDRAYARQLTYAITILLSLEQEALESTNDTSAKALLTSSSESLNNILPAFSEFSETGN